MFNKLSRQQGINLLLVITSTTVLIGMFVGWKWAIACLVVWILVVNLITLLRKEN